MAERKSGNLRELSAKWTCNVFAITNHEGDSIALLRKVADSLEQLGAIDILDITYRRSHDVSIAEITVTVYFALL